MQQLRRAQEPVPPIGTMQAGCMCVRASIVFKTMSLAAVAGVLLAAGAAEAEPARFRIQPEASDVGFKATSRLMDADGSSRASRAR